MNIAIRYFTESKKGNTAKLANTIAEALALEPTEDMAKVEECIVSLL